ncbi:hypothetical protein Hanom_Chr16g01449091 [Helianthus anomalus]
MQNRVGPGRFSVLFMVKPVLDLWTRTDPIFRVVNRFYILCLIGSRVGSGNGRVESGFSFCSPLILTIHKYRLILDDWLFIYFKLYYTY